MIEKEPICGAHASGRSSGVLHAGFYYSPDSLKVRFTKSGNERLTAYCEDKGIAVNQCGKLVVARDAADLPSLDELLRRGRHNDIDVQCVTEAEAKTCALLAPHLDRESRAGGAGP